MPRIYLSPSTQEYNMYYDGSGSEEYYMNVIADYMEPYLTASGISFKRNDPEKTVGNSVRDSNSGNYDFHLAIHSNAAGPSNYGQATGSQVYYYTWSPEGESAAADFVNEMKNIYYDPNNVRAIPSTSLYELNNTIAPAVLVEIAYHDNPQDAQWIKNNLILIARTLSKATAEYLGVPFVEPSLPSTGQVATQGGKLNVRNAPSMDGEIIGQLANGTAVNILGETNGWYQINFGDTTGFVSSSYISLR